MHRHERGELGLIKLRREEGEKSEERGRTEWGEGERGWEAGKERRGERS
jgi:hypothetical protein